MKITPMLSVNTYSILVDHAKTLIAIMDEACMSLRDQTYHLGHMDHGAGSDHQLALFDDTAEILNMIKSCRHRVRQLHETRIRMGDNPNPNQ